MTATMKALEVQEVGKPLVLVDKGIPQPGEGQVQIKVTVAGLNPHDQRSRDWGLLIADMLPFVLGKDVVGTVSKLGDGVTAFKVGDRIMSLAYASAGAPQSGLQEYALADTINMCRIPDALSDEDATTIPTNLNSSFIALFIVLGIPAPWSQGSQVPEKLLIVGGGTNCGNFAVQLAKLAGIKTIVVIGGDGKVLKSLGATHVIDRHAGEDEILRQVHDAVGNDLLYVFDTVNMPDGLGMGLKALSKDKKGKLAQLVPLGEVDGGKHEVLPVYGNMYAHDKLSVECWDRLPGYIDSGAIRPTANNTIKAGLDASAVNELLDNYRDGKRMAKPQVFL